MTDPETTEQYAKRRARELLPCHPGRSCAGDAYRRPHATSCPGYYRPAVANEIARLKRERDESIFRLDGLAQRSVRATPDDTRSAKFWPEWLKATAFLAALDAEGVGE